MSILEGLQESVKTALKTGDKERVTVLRMIVNELQKEAKADAPGAGRERRAGRAEA